MDMGIESLVIVLLIGAVAGWLAGTNNGWAWIWVNWQYTRWNYWRFCCWTNFSNAGLFDRHGNFGFYHPRNDWSHRRPLCSRISQTGVIKLHHLTSAEYKVKYCDLKTL